MKEYVGKQLEEQIGKMINALAEGDAAQVESRFGAVVEFYLKDEKEFTDRIPDNEKKRDKKIEEMKEKFVKALETALEHEVLDDKVKHAVQCYHALEDTQQRTISEYFNDLVESVVSYKRNVLDRSDGKMVDAKPVVGSTDDMDEFLDAKE